MSEILILIIGSILFSVGFGIRFRQTKVLPYGIVSILFLIFTFFSSVLLAAYSSETAYVADVSIAVLVLTLWSMFLLFPLSATLRKRASYVVLGAVCLVLFLFFVVFLLSDFSSVLVAVRGILTIPLLLGGVYFSIHRLFRSGRRGSMYFFLFIVLATSLTSFAITGEAIRYLMLLAFSVYCAFAFFYFYSYFSKVEKVDDVFGKKVIRILSLRSRIFLLVLTVVVFASLMISSIFFVVSRDVAEVEAFNILRSGSSATVQIVENVVERDVQDIQKFSESIQVENILLGEEIDENLLSFGDTRTLNELYVLDDSNKVLYQEAREGSVRSISSFTPFINDVNGVTFDFQNEQYVVNVSIKQSDRYVGSIIGVYSFDLIVESLGKMSAQETGEVFIVGGSNQYWSESGFGVVPKDGSASFYVCTDIMRSCASGECNDGDLSRQDERIGLFGVDVFSITRYIPDLNVCSIHEIDQGQVSVQPSRSTVIVASTIFIILLLVIIFATQYLSKSITQSLVTLQEGVRRVRSGKYGEKITIDSNDEIAELAQTFNRLSASLKDARESTEENIAKQTQELKGQRDKLEKTQRAMLNVLQDVSLDKERLQHEKEKIEVIVQGMQDAFVFISSEGAIDIYNKTAELILGHLSSDVIGEPYLDFISLYENTEELFTIDFNDLRAGNDILAKSLFVKNVHDQMIPVRVSVSSVRYENETIGFALLFQDVTKEREIENMKSNFVSIVSHQLRTPLSAIKWLLEMVLGKDAGDISQEQEDYLSRAYDSNERMITLVSELLKVSRLESCKIKAEPKIMDLKTVIHGVINDHKVNAKAHNCELGFSTETEEIPEIQADPTLIQNVLDNFVSNAIDYASTQKKNEIQIGVKVEKNELIVAVKDDGIGIKAEDQEKVFGMFYRGDNARKARTDGSGLGLYIARLMVELSGGKIWFESEYEKGSTFYFSLPR